VTEAAVIAGMVAAFAVLLALKRLSGLRFCVLCVTVGATWLALLALHWAGTYENRVLLALLMGQTITGLHYLVEGRVREELLVFRLPFVLTLVALFYLAIAPEILEGRPVLVKSADPRLRAQTRGVTFGA
jgi:hypothetical protein